MYTPEGMKAAQDAFNDLLREEFTHHIVIEHCEKGIPFEHMRVWARDLADERVELTLDQIIDIYRQAEHEARRRVRSLCRDMRPDYPPEVAARLIHDCGRFHKYFPPSMIDGGFIWRAWIEQYGDRYIERFQRAVWRKHNLPEWEKSDELLRKTGDMGKLRVSKSTTGYLHGGRYPGRVGLHPTNILLDGSPLLAHPNQFVFVEGAEEHIHVKYFVASTDLKHLSDRLF